MPKPETAPAVIPQDGDSGWRQRALDAERKLAVGGKEVQDAKLFLINAMELDCTYGVPGFVEVVQEAAGRLYDLTQRSKPKPKAEEIGHEQAQITRVS